MGAQRSLVVLVSTLALASCASTRDLAPLIAGERQNARMALETGSTDLTPPDWQDEGDAALPTITVKTRFLAVEPELAERILGEHATGLVSLLTSREQTDRALGDLHAAGQLSKEAEIQRTMLTLRDGQTGNVMVVRQEAYIESYELVVTADAAIADPQVGVLQDGIMLVITARNDGESGKTALDFGLTLTEYERPFKVREIELISAASPVQIQVPEGLVRRLSTSANMGPNDVLVIGGCALPLEDDKVLLAFVAVE